MDIMFAVEVKGKPEYHEVLDEMDLESDGEFEFAAWRYKSPARVVIVVYGPAVLKKVALSVRGCKTIPGLAARNELEKGKAKVITHDSVKEVQQVIGDWEGVRKKSQSDGDSVGNLRSFLIDELGEDRIVG